VKPASESSLKTFPRSEQLWHVVEKWQRIITPKGASKSFQMAINQIANWAFVAGQKAHAERLTSYLDYKPTESDAILLHGLGVKWS
jgi:hypothetical protein